MSCEVKIGDKCLNGKCDGMYILDESLEEDRILCDICYLTIEEAKGEAWL